MTEVGITIISQSLLETEMYYTGSETARRLLAMRLHVEIKSWQPEV